MARWKEPCPSSSAPWRWPEGCRCNVNLGNKAPEALDALTAPLAGKGSFGKAIETAVRAEKQAKLTGLDDRASQISKRIELYRMDKRHGDL